MFDRVYGNELDRHNREVFNYKNNVQTTYASTSSRYGTFQDSVKAQNAAANRGRWVRKGDYLVQVFD